MRAAAARRPAAAAARDLLLAPGRDGSSSLLPPSRSSSLIWRAFGDVPAPFAVLSTAATVALAFSVLFFLWRLFFLVQRRLLWRVRRKLILSYIFIGVVPALLIIGFFLLGSAVLFMDVAAYLFRDGYDEVVVDVQFMAEAAALEIGAHPDDRERRSSASQRIRVAVSYPTLSLASSSPRRRRPSCRRGGRGSTCAVPVSRCRRG